MSSVKDIAWLAGFLEGEGCFYFNVNACRVQVVQKDPWPLIRMQQITGGNVTQVRGGKGRMYYALFLVGSRAVSVMLSVYPLMSPRRQQKIISNLSQWRIRKLRGKCNIKTHCKRGHPLNAETTFMQSNGKSRECSVCSKINKANWYERSKLQSVV